MHNVTDYIIGVTFIYFFYRGWSKGFLKTVLGPLSLIGGCLISYIYYQKTQNILTSLAICFIGPFLINILAAIIIRLWHKTVNSDIPPSPLSRLCGSAFSIVWSGGYLLFFLILIALSPFRFGWLGTIQDDVLASKSYAFIEKQADAKMPKALPDIKKITNVLQDPSKLKKFESTEEFQALEEDPRLAELLDDRDVAELLRNKDYRGLLSNAKMQALFQDEELIKKIFALNKRILEEGLEEDPAQEGPRVIEIPVE